MSLSWADSAVLSAALLAAVNVVDSHLLTRRMPSLRAFLIAAAVIAIGYGSITLIIFPLPQNVGASPVLMAIASSVLRGAGILLFLYVLQTEEVSRVMPVVNIHPVFVAILAIPILSESLILMEWLAVFITVAGAIIISMKPGIHSVHEWLGKPVTLPFLASLLMAGANLTSKRALEDISFWNMYAIGSIGMACVFLAFSLRPKAIRELYSLRRSVSTATILIINETLVPFAALLLYWSIERGPVSLVSAIAGSQPLFVFIYALILSRISTFLLEERMTRRTIIMRFVAIGMIVGGITIIHLV